MGRSPHRLRPPKPAGRINVAATIVPPSVSYSPDCHLTWSLTCSYSQMLASQNPTSCVPLPSFYNPMIIPCPSCACGCQHKKNCA
ncbi:hypothetical protein C1H46_012779 [Malus baccata]|uniref:COBRA C-terminal domain-containing protein n=1 Tax=Malus baccata TaxID=106549 RepID=A0A540MRX4_MALBA|nr:hypothetical protein C1H46_012779 [Malus baccata]